MTMIDPLAETCPACLAPPYEPCIATSSDLPREHLHRLRGLAAAEQLTRCDACTGSGWEPAGSGPQSAILLVCPVCAAQSYEACTEGGEARHGHHRVRIRAAELDLALCGACDGIGWLPDNGQVQP